MVSYIVQCLLHLGGVAMADNRILESAWDDSPVDITPEANEIWGIARKLRGSYMPDKYGDVVT